jgi:hypothetical protein
MPYGCTMDHLVHAVRDAVRQQNWYAAVSLALTLPDICGRIDDETSSSTKRYVAWWNANLLAEYTMQTHRGPHVFLTGEDCYALRCAFLHQGAFDVLDQRVRQVLTRLQFLVPPGNNVMHKIGAGGWLALQVSEFCEDVCRAVERWQVTANQVPEKAQRIASLGRIQIAVPGQSFGVGP